MADDTYSERIASPYDGRPTSLVPVPAMKHTTHHKPATDRRSAPEARKGRSRRRVTLLLAGGLLLLALRALLRRA